MSELTAGQLWARGEDLEQSAATLLGKMLFEYSRLDVALGLCLVWSGEGRQIEALTEKIGAFSFHKRLDFLEKLVGQSFVQGSKKHFAYLDWLKLAHATRAIRNQLVHGRWGVDPNRDVVLNVVGLPTSPGQIEVPYSIQQLNDYLEDIKSLTTGLGQLRSKWPV